MQLNKIIKTVLHSHMLFSNTWILQSQSNINCVDCCEFVCGLQKKIILYIGGRTATVIESNHQNHCKSAFTKPNWWLWQIYPIVKSEDTVMVRFEVFQQYLAQKTLITKFKQRKSTQNWQSYCEDKFGMDRYFRLTMQLPMKRWCPNNWECSV